MTGYYLGLAVHNLRRSPWLTALIVLAVAIGIGSSMTVLTILHTMSGDPLPQKSARLFAPQIANWKADDLQPTGEPPSQLSYRDATALMGAHQGIRRTALYGTGFPVTPADHALAPFRASGRAVYADFFAMFDAPFAGGAPWSPADDEAHAAVVVLGAKIAAKLFPHADPVGRTIDLAQHQYRIVGVLKPWELVPRVYDVAIFGYQDTEDVFLPFTTAIDRQLPINGNISCNAPPEPGWQGQLNSECIWQGFWVELPDAAAVARYRLFLDAYAADQQRSGRFTWPANTRLRNAQQWLVFNKVVPNDVRLNSLLGLGFLLVCLVNAIGLLLARFNGRARDLGVRRALGASRQNIVAQCLTETALVGFVGGLVGLGFAALGLAAERAILPPALAKVTHLDATMMAIIVLAAVVATLGAGLYPVLRSSRISPSSQLRGA